MSTEKELKPKVGRGRRLNSVWIIPAVALVLAGWLVWKNSVGQGPVVRISFETAEGLSAGKTEVRCRSVKIGAVEMVKLKSDLSGVDVTVRINSDSENLLREDSRFWVVRPRISAQSVSGVDTLLSGAYIELDPGESEKGKREFKGLEEPPVTSSSVPGLRLKLTAKEAGSLAVGSPVYYRGFEVGRVELRTLDVEVNEIKFSVFIKEQYSSLVYENTRFWNASGVKIDAGASGLKLRTPSLKALVAGGVSFDVLKGHKPGRVAHNGELFTLYDGRSEAEAPLFQPDYQILLMFDQSVRGLKWGDPVEYRGLTFGRVADISYQYSEDGDLRVPVLIEVDSSALEKKFKSKHLNDDVLRSMVHRGLRAQLSTASMLTGSLFVELDFGDQPGPEKLEFVNDFPVIPTVESGLGLIEKKLNAFLDKLDAMPLEETMVKFGKTADEATLTLAESRTTLDELDKTLQDLHLILSSDDTQQLTKNLNQALVELRKTVESVGPNGSVQGDLRRTMDELRSAIRSFDSLSRTLDDKPSSIFFGKDSSGNPIPRARR